MLRPGTGMCVLEIGHLKNRKKIILDPKISIKIGNYTPLIVVSPSKKALNVAKKLTKELKSSPVEVSWHLHCDYKEACDKEFLSEVIKTLNTKNKYFYRVIIFIPNS